MSRFTTVIALAALFSLSAAAQSQTGAQAGALVGGQAPVGAGKTQAQTPAGTSTSASASAQNDQANGSLASGTTFNAVLSAPVDSKKCKEGDSVTAHSTEAVKSEGKTVIPKGSKLIGHVTQTSARANGQADSTLGIVFDKAILRNGQEIPLNVAIQALASAQSYASLAAPDLDTMGGMAGSAGASGMSGGRNALGDVTSTAGGAVGTVTNTAANVGGVGGAPVGSTTNAAGATSGAVGGLNVAGQFTSNSRGVFGLNGISLNAATSNTTQGSVITSTGKNVHLDCGTRMLLVSQAAAGVEGHGESKQPSGDKTEPKREQKPGASRPNRQ